MAPVAGSGSDTVGDDSSGSDGTRAGGGRCDVLGGDRWFAAALVEVTGWAAVLMAAELTRCERQWLRLARVKATCGSAMHPR
jgi:hypothetical protein